MAFIAITAYSHKAYAQSSIDSGGAGGGAIIPGDDTRACNGTNAGALRFKAADNCVAYCNGAGSWICPGASSTCANPKRIWRPRMVGTGNGFGTIALSDDGSTIVVASNNGNTTGPLFVSKDTGATWVQRDTDRRWQRVAVSSNGGVTAGVVYGGRVFTSTDGGTTWNQQDSADRNWIDITMSSDGTRMLGATENGRLFLSTDTGVTWTQINVAPVNTDRPWSMVSSSHDGQTLAAATNYGYIYVSVNGGTSWTARANQGYWTSVNVSSSGARMFGHSSWVDNTYISTNSGTTWTAQPAFYALDVGAERYGMSDDASILVASALGGKVASSTDYGATAAREKYSPTNVASAVVSGNGLVMAAIDTGNMMVNVSTQWACTTN